ncbi:hypothetical protein F4777DRAFT_478322 [Nemania sp. FL0916]|nr:hypothetical protein F4777DRAFT_478322 [Nemania sp. FL0916]
MPGETGAVLDMISLPMAMILAGLFGICLYNSIEIYLYIFGTFRRFRGLYFWSMLAANTGIPIHAIFSVLRYFEVAPSGPMAICINVGWWLMAMGQALMLYSRLHLLICDPRKLRWVLCIIAGVFLCVQIPTATLFAVISFRDSTKMDAPDSYDAIEIVELVALALEESLLSGLYVFASRHTLKPMMLLKGPKVRKLLRELLGLFVLVVALDVSLIIIQLANYYYIQTTYKPVVYSIKLKVEIYVLNNLVGLLLQSGCNCQHMGSAESNRPALQPTTTNTGRSRYPPSIDVTASDVAMQGISPAEGDGPHVSATTEEESITRVPNKSMSF